MPSSYYERIVALETIEMEIAALHEEIYKNSLMMRKHQKNCHHEVIIHYGDDKHFQMYQQSYILGNFYCPLCGQRSFRIERSDKGKTFLIEASGYKNPNPEANLREVLCIYKSCALMLNPVNEKILNPNFNPAEELVKCILHNTGIDYYRVNALEW